MFPHNIPFNFGIPSEGPPGISLRPFPDAQYLTAFHREEPEARVAAENFATNHRVTRRRRGPPPNQVQIEIPWPGMTQIAVLHPK